MEKIEQKARLSFLSEQLVSPYSTTKIKDSYEGSCKHLMLPNPIFPYFRSTQVQSEYGEYPPIDTSSSNHLVNRNSSSPFKRQDIKG